MKNNTEYKFHHEMPRLNFHNNQENESYRLVFHSTFEMVLNIYS